MIAAAFALVLTLDQQAPAAPVPRPFPQPSAPAGRSAQPTTAPTAPVTATPPAPQTPIVLATPQASAPPTEEMLGVPLYPGAQFLASFDAGRGQKFYLYGSTTSFVDLVSFYRNVLKQRGELVFDAPATHEFDVGRFREETMAFPPGVTIKEYKSSISDGYPNPKPGGQPARFPTIIQIVPVTER